MGFVLLYIQTTKSGTRYRRRIPQDVKELLNKTWFLKPLGKTRSEIIRNYGPTNEEFERLVEGAQRRLSQETSEPLDIQELTDIELYQEVLQRLRANNFQHPVPPHDQLDPHADDELYLRDIEADRVIGDYPIDPEDGGPVGMTRVDAAYVRALYNGPPEQPSPSLEDARQSYIKDREYEDGADSKNLLNVDLVDHTSPRISNQGSHCVGLLGVCWRYASHASQLTKIGYPPENPWREQQV